MCYGNSSLLGVAELIYLELMAYLTKVKADWIKNPESTLKSVLYFDVIIEVDEVVAHKLIDHRNLRDEWVEGSGPILNFL